MTSLVVMAQIETDDPRLSLESLATAVTTSATTTAALRQTVLDHLPDDVTRLIAVLPLEQARRLMWLHERMGDLTGDSTFVRPPSGYVPPGGR
jgi:hypothetical protein